jgi:hypothetical protein
MASPRVYPTVWLDNGKINISGGQNVRGAADGRSVSQLDLQDVDSTTEVLDPTTKTLVQGATMPFNGQGAGLIAKAGDRTFAFTLDKVGEGYALGTATKELTAPDGVAAHNVYNYFNGPTVTVAGDVNVDLDVTLANVTNVNEITLEEADRSPIQIGGQTVNVLDFQRTTGSTGPAAFAGSQDFFCQPLHKGQKLIGVGDVGGQRTLIGSPAGARTPLPKSSSFVLFDPASQKSTAFTTDANGRFAVPLPSGGRGPLYIARLDDDSGVAVKLSV